MRHSLSGDRVSAKVRWWSVLLSVASFLLSGCSATQESVVPCYYLMKASQRSLPMNDLYVLNVDTKQGTRLDVYFQILYSHIHFEKDLDVFKGSYTVSYILRDENDQVVQTKDVDRTVAARSYGESMSSLHDGFLEMFYVPPGAYSLNVIVTDIRSGLKYRRRLKIPVRTFSKQEFCVSDYLLFERARSESGIISLSPIFPTQLSFASDTIGVFQELYNVRRGDTLRLILTSAAAIDKGHKELKSSSVFTPYLVSLPVCKRTADSVYSVSDSVLVATADGTLQILQLFPKPAEGVTTLQRTLILKRGGVADTSGTTARIPIYSPTFPHLKNLDEEVAAVSYIARPEEFDSLHVPGTARELGVRLARFWEDHGGEIRRKEFLARAEEANELFSSCTEGWKTPMGIVYIVCGPPDYIDCQGRISEVWYYDLGGNRAFPIPFRQSYEVDYDRYFEIAPFTVNDFLWQQFVDKWKK